MQKEVGPKVKIFNHQGHQGKTQRSQIYHNQAHVFLPLVRTLCP